MAAGEDATKGRTQAAKEDVTVNNVKMWVSEETPIESQAYDQIKAMASLPILAGHVAIMPDVHWGKGATVGSVIPTRGAIIPAAVGVDLGCFVGETKIPLLDGTQKTLVELAQDHTPFWVYSLNATLDIVPGRAITLKTRENAPLVKVTVSGGDEIICTPDHPFMLVDGRYKEAQDLSFNESLMPLYRRWQTRDGYESCSRGSGTYRMTHIRVWESLNGDLPPGFVIHHKNHNHFDNRPDNLVAMEASAHSAYHRQIGHQFCNDDPRFQAKRLAGIRGRAANPGEREKMAKIGTQNITTYMLGHPEHFAESVRDNGKRGRQYLVKFNQSSRACSECGEVLTNPAALRWHKKREHEELSVNHKVVSVEKLDYTADVYCLQVEDHHNFALAAGVFVHNCGMAALRTSMRVDQLPDSLSDWRSAIERAIPVGFNAHDNERTLDKVHRLGTHMLFEAVLRTLRDRFNDLPLHAQIPHNPRHKTEAVAWKQIGTLGGGNHFIEVQVGDDGHVWLMLHSGSRNVGKTLAEVAISQARAESEQRGDVLPDKDLAWLFEGSDSFSAYVTALWWAQDYARVNREVMLALLWQALQPYLPDGTTITQAINCHHNYVEQFADGLYVTRKGAVSARVGEWGIIPGSMGTASYIVRGKGNPEAYYSCSHGAGRRMSRNQAKKTFTVEDLIAQTAGVESRKNAAVVDEIPRAYKDIDAVIAAQADLIEPVVRLKQVLCVKG